MIIETEDQAICNELILRYSNKRDTLELFKKQWIVARYTYKCVNGVFVDFKAELQVVVPVPDYRPQMMKGG